MCYKEVKLLLMESAILYIYIIIYISLSATISIKYLNTEPLNTETFVFDQDVF